MDNNLLTTGTLAVLAVILLASLLAIRESSLKESDPWELRQPLKGNSSPFRGAMNSLKRIRGGKSLKELFGADFPKVPAFLIREISLKRIAGGDPLKQSGILLREFPLKDSRATPSKLLREQVGLISVGMLTGAVCRRGLWSRSGRVGDCPTLGEGVNGAQGAAKRPQTETLRGNPLASDLETASVLHLTRRKALASELKTASGSSDSIEGMS